MTATEHLAQLLQVQGGLLDAYLEQNLGARYAYVILVCETQTPRAVRAVTNWADAGAVRALVRHVTHISHVERAAPLPVERAPRLCDVAVSG